MLYNLKPRVKIAENHFSRLTYNGEISFYDLNLRALNQFCVIWENSILLLYTSDDTEQQKTGVFKKYFWMKLLFEKLLIKCAYIQITFYTK